MLSGDSLSVSQSTFWSVAGFCTLLEPAKCSKDHRVFVLHHEIRTVIGSVRGIPLKKERMYHLTPHPPKAPQGQRSQPARISTGVGCVSLQAEMWGWRGAHQIKKKKWQSLVGEYFMRLDCSPITQRIDGNRALAASKAFTALGLQSLEKQNFLHDEILPTRLFLFLDNSY